MEKELEDLDINKENNIEFISGTHYATCSFTNRSKINRIKTIYGDRKSEFKYFIENDDGSVCAKIPLKWIKINPGALPNPNKPKRVLSEEQKRKMQAALQAKKTKANT